MTENIKCPQCPKCSGQTILVKETNIKTKAVLFRFICSACRIFTDKYKI